MNLLPKLFKRTPEKVQKREYAAAKMNRLLSSWIAGVESPDSILKNGSLTLLRNRARTLCQNDDYARRYLQLLVSNVVGADGVRLEMDVRDLNGRADRQANDIIEQHWKMFSKHPTTDRRMTMVDLQAQALTSTARDGEMFYQIVRNFGNESNFALRPFEGDYLEDNYNHDMPNGASIRMSVELSEWGEPVRYHILTGHPGDSVAKQRKAIPSDQIIHVYRMDRPMQTRGVTWFASSMIGLHHLREYFKSEAVAARVASAKAGFFVQDKDSAETYTGDGEDAYGNQIMDVAPGSFQELPPGMRIETYDPKNPNSNFDAFTKTNLRSIAAGLGVSYNSLASDLESVNYSSLRAGALEEREFYKSVQRWLVDHFMTPVFEAWLMHKLRRGDMGLPVDKFAKFNSPRWITRRWPWVDPQKDVAASILAINNLLRTRGAVIAENYGENFADTALKASEEEAILQQYGLSVKPTSTSPNDGAGINGE